MLYASSGTSHAGNLQKIITALESDEPGHPQEAAADAS
jgi:hypothetical protein